MRDEQVRRYSRHILLPDVGGLGQTALLVSSARLELREREPQAELIAAQFLAAGGVGTVVVRGANAAQVAELAAHGPDARIVTEPVLQPDGRDTSRGVMLQPQPAWWPSPRATRPRSRTGAAASPRRWMAEIANR